MNSRTMTTIALGGYLLLLAGQVLAVDTTTAAGGGVAGLTDEIGTQFSAFMVLAIQILAAAAFLIVGYGVVSMFAKAIGGRAEWAGVVLPILFGAVVLIVTAYMFTEADTLAKAIGTAAKKGP